MRGLPPNPLAALAAAATPVVAAALITVAVIIAGSCEGRLASPPASGQPVSPAPAESLTGTGAQPPATADPATGSRLLVVVGAPSRPRAWVQDVATPGTAGLPVNLPAPVAGDRLAMLVVAPDGRLAAVTQGARAWIAPPARTGADGRGWEPLRVALDRPLPGPVLGATWTRDATRLVLLAAAPGSGTRRTALVSVPLDGTSAMTIEVPLEADGPGIAALPEGRTAFVGRDRGDQGTLAQVSATGSFVTRPVAARSMAVGGDLVALVGDAAVWVGTLADLDGGALPTEPLPLDGAGAIGAVAIAPDGSAVAVVRLDPSGAAARIEVLRRAGGRWLAAGSVGLDPLDGTANPAWLP